ncbi:MAG: hypothetical protein ACYTCN_09675 [Planctomycetota bacterium]|jgi:hypothetical protein
MAGETRNTPFGSLGSLRPTRPDQNRFDDDGDNSFQSLRGGLRPNIRSGNKPLTYTPRPNRKRFSRRPQPAPPQAPNIADVRAGKTALITTDPDLRTDEQSLSVANLFQAPIAGLSATAVEQKGARFESVTDVFGSGETVPNLGDKTTKEAFNRYFSGNRDEDPTRIAFQSRFFSGETIKDVNDLTPTSLLFRQQELEKRKRNK